MSTPTDTSLSTAELAALRVIAGTMVPADAELGMPGGDEPAILADIQRAIGRDLPLVRTALSDIDAKAGGHFGGLDRDTREALINDYYAGSGAAGVALGRVIVSAYYRDERVLLALGMEARPPFPKGYAIEPGDWSLLDAVRERAPFWRDDRHTPRGDR